MLQSEGRKQAVESEPESEPESEFELDSKSGSGSKSESDYEFDLESESDMESDMESTSKAESESESESESLLQSELKLNSESKSGSASDLEITSEFLLASELKSISESESGSDSKLESKLKWELESKLESKSESHKRKESLDIFRDESLTFISNPHSLSLTSDHIRSNYESLMNSESAASGSTIFYRFFKKALFWQNQFFIEKNNIVGEGDPIELNTKEEMLEGKDDGFFFFDTSHGTKKASDLWHTSNFLKQGETDSRLAHYRDKISSTLYSHKLNHIEIDETENLINSQVTEQSTSLNKQSRCIEVDKVLVFDVYKLKFHHHPLMLKEEKMLQEVVYLYNIYQENIKIKKVHFFKLRLRSFLDYMSMDLDLIIADEEKESSNIIESVKNTKANITNLFDNLVVLVGNMVISQHDLSTLESTLWMKWKELEKAREKQGFQCSPVALKKLSVDEKPEKKTSIRGMIKTLNGFSQVFNSKICPQNEKNDLFKKILASLNIIKSIESKRCKIVMDNSNNIPEKTITYEEKQRRNKMLAEKYVAKIFLNEKIVDSTPACNLEWPSFNINFRMQIRCQVPPNTDCVCVKIYKRIYNSVLPDSLLCSNYMTISEDGECQNTHPPPLRAWYSFTSITSKYCNSIRGAILFSISWKQISSASSQIGCRNINHLAPKRHNTLIKVTKKIPQLFSNPLNYDIENRALLKQYPAYYSSLNDSSMNFSLFGSKVSLLKYFRLQEPRRHLLIKYRYYNYPLPNPSPIPLNEQFLDQEQTYQDIFQAIEHSYDKELEDLACRERPVVERKYIKDYIKRFCKIKKQKRLFILDDIVQDKNELRNSDSPNFEWLKKLLCPPRKRTLFPRNNFTLQNNPMERKQSIRVLMTVVGAKNVPLRQTTRQRSSFVPSTFESSSGIEEKDSLHEPFILNELASVTNSFITIKFQDNCFRTRPIPGHSPQWRQTFEIILDNIIPSSLRINREIIEIKIFDDVKTDFGASGGYYDDEDTVLHEKRFLGCIFLPLRTILTNGNIQGNFPLIIPDIIVGYGRNSWNPDEISRDSNTARHYEQQETLNNEYNYTTSLKLLFSLDPMASVCNKHEHMMYSSKEDQSILSHAKLWTEGYYSRGSLFKKRYCQVVIPDSNDNEWLITRFLKGQAPPHNFEKSMHKCAHFVSLIPFLYDWQAFNRENDKGWYTSQEFLNLLAGDWEEHAVLLANYFMYINDQDPNSFGMDIYLAFGSNILHGNVVYVMTKIKVEDTLTFWDPATATAYKKDDENCPLVNIGCLVSSSNIYANLQQVGHPSLMDFKLNINTKWKSFYINEIITSQKNLPSIQDLTLIYSQPNTKMATSLELEIESGIKTMIRGSRRIPTSFNYELSKRLRNILENLEEKRLSGANISHSRDQTLHDITTKGMNINGVSSHYPFTNINHIIEKARMTDVHKNMHPNIEFAIAVKVFPYVCNVFSVRLYICALSQN